MTDWTEVNDFGHHGITNDECCLYVEVKEKLEADLASGKEFDTNFHGFKKEIESMKVRTVCDNTALEITVWCGMDELHDLIGCDLDVELTDEEAEELEKLWDMELESATEFETGMFIPRESSVQDVIRCASKLAGLANAQLEYWFEWLNNEAKFIVNAREKRGE